ncbi:thioredoxin domain-containing protein 9 [Bacillus rossius redtenbacheri]|uniref:thioredoxin domain-containing protein 9 n=1 Tax=Bacillus rossius redtenbacheri TaxID=93214 RepID=UPI002FDDCAD7
MDAGQVLQQQLLRAAEVVEEQLDDELRKLDRLDEDGMEELRERRLRALKKQAEQRQLWLSAGHGEYSELPEEKEFFEVTKKSANVVCHFYKNDSPRCKIVDHHLRALARSHVETRFVKLDVERCPFLTGRLRIKVIPTLALVKEGKTKDYVVGFTDLGNRDDFSTETLEWRIAQAGVISYAGSLLEPPDESRRRPADLLGRGGPKKTIRGRDDSDDSGDDL